MSITRQLLNQVRQQRQARGWSQDELAIRSGLSRTGISAIEQHRLIPSGAAMLALAEVFGCAVEELFRLQAAGERAEPLWAWEPRASTARYWEAEVQGRAVRYPAEVGAPAHLRHDGIWSGDRAEPLSASPPSSLAIATCDPAIGLLAERLSADANLRLLAFTRSSRSALALLKQGLAHVAGLHLSSSDDEDQNAQVVRAELGPQYRLIRVARWEEGIAHTGHERAKSLAQILKRPLRWVGREPGSAARHCQDDLLGDRRAPRRLAYDHRGVAEAIRCGWADAGVCHRLVAEETGLSFVPARREHYDLCYHESFADDRRFQALVAALASNDYRRTIADLPGYELRLALD